MSLYIRQFKHGKVALKMNNKKPDFYKPGFLLKKLIN